MQREELITQYDRFLAQVREEAKDLYWLYNFFFVVESALLGALLAGKMNPQYFLLVYTIGLALSIYWFMIIRKQRLWRNDRIRRIQEIEEKLGYPSEVHMWPAKKEVRFFKEYVFGKRGLWRFLFLLPLGFSIVWVILFVHTY